MRKIIPFPVILIIGLILCAAAVGLWYFLHSLPVEKVLPADPLVFVRLTDLEKNWASFTETAFWEKVNRVDWRRFLEISGASQRDLAFYDAWDKMMAAPEADKIFRELMGRDIVLAVYGGGETGLEPSSPMDIFSRLVLVARLKPGRQALDLLGPILAEKRQDISHSKRRYRNHDIHILKIRGMDADLAYTRMADLLIIGITADMPKRCLEVAGDRSRTLAGDDAYRKVRSGYLSEPGIRCFINLGSLAAQLKEGIVTLVAGKQKKDPDEVRKQFGAGMNQMFGFRLLGFSGSFDSLVRAKADLYYDTQEVDPRLFSIDQCEPKQNDSLAFIPREVLSYQWSTCYDFGYLLKQAREEIPPADALNEDKASAGEAMASLEKKINVNLAEDIVPLLGQEIGNALYDIDIGETYPVPQMLFFVSVKDKQAAAGMLRRLTGQVPLIRMETREYRDSRIRYFSLPLPAGLQPGYVFIGDYLVLATQKDLLEKCLDSRQAQDAGLTEPRLLKGASLGLDDQYNSLFYVDVDRLAGRLEKVMAWGHAWLKKQEEKRAAFRQGQINVLKDVRQKIDADLEELKSVRAELKEVQPQKEEALLLDSQIRDITGSIGRFRESGEEPEAASGAASQIRELRSRLERLQAQKDRIKPPLHKIRRMESRAESLEDQIEANRDREENVEKIIQAARPDDMEVTERRAAFIKEFFRPMLEALTECEMLTTELIFKKGLIEAQLLLPLQ